MNELITQPANLTATELHPRSTVCSILRLCRPDSSSRQFTLHPSCVSTSHERLLTWPILLFCQGPQTVWRVGIAGRGGVNPFLQFTSTDSRL